MTLLNNELVLKYFGGHDGKHIDGMCDDLIALRVIQAMQEPIKKGEKYLIWDSITSFVKEDESFSTLGPGVVSLRLPDRFQKRLTMGCIHGEECACFSQPKDEVEEKINDLVDRWQYYDFQTVRKELRELVELARKQI